MEDNGSNTDDDTNKDGFSSDEDDCDSEYIELRAMDFVEVEMVENNVFNVLGGIEGLLAT